MTDQETAGSVSEESQPIGFANFLEKTPPSQFIQGVVQVWGISHGQYGKSERVQRPDLRLHCDNEHCNGITFHRFKEGDTNFFEQTSNMFITYQCSNCQLDTTMYSLHLVKKANGAAYCYKFGEFPPYGVPTPPRLLRLFENERDIYLKGRRCEHQGLGIGAFVYYRRVVEHQKNKIIDEIIKVAAKLNVDQITLDALVTAKTEIQFSKAMESLKDAMPQALLINGHNPLTLLHSALSRGLHNESDSECLDLARTIRVVLSELAERLGQALKDEAELNTAISRLTQKRPGS